MTTWKTILHQGEM